MFPTSIEAEWARPEKPVEAWKTTNGDDVLSIVTAGETVTGEPRPLHETPDGEAKKDADAEPEPLSASKETRTHPLCDAERDTVLEDVRVLESPPEVIDKRRAPVAVREST